MLRKTAPKKGGFSVAGRTCDYPPIARVACSRSSLRSIAEGAPSNHQRMLMESIKRARNIALLPFATD